MTTAPPSDPTDLIAQALAAVGVQEGDMILVHSNTDVLEELMPAVDMVDRFAGLLTGLQRAVGNDGTVVVPTFTYSLAEGRVFNPSKSSSRVGFFSNYVRRRPAALRSHHPMFSFAAIGPAAADLLGGIPETCYGPGSVFDRLRLRRARIVFFNCKFYYCTYLHHVEELVGVDYRYFKEFVGPVLVDGEQQEARAIFYARFLERDVNSDFAVFAERLLADGLLRRAPLGSGCVMAIETQELFDATASALAVEPYLLLAHPPKPAA